MFFSSLPYSKQNNITSTMSNSTIVSAINKSLSLLSSLQTKVDALELQLNNGVVTPSSMPNQASYVAIATFESQNKRVDTIETSVRDLTRNMSDIRTALAQCRDDISKERSLIETSVVFKAEQFMNRSIKERIDNNMYDIKAFTENKCSEVEGNVIARLQQMMFEQESSLKELILKACVEQVKPPIVSSPIIVSPSPSSSTVDVDATTVTPLTEPVAQVESPPLNVERNIDILDEATSVSPPPPEAPTVQPPSDFTAGRRKIIKGPRKT
jgi:hypothetical protein